MFKEVEWKAQDTISTRWVVTGKHKKEGKTVKARLVARGFEEELDENVATESSTCSREALRLTITIMSHN